MSARSIYWFAVALPVFAVAAFGFSNPDRLGDLTRVVFDAYQRALPRTYDPALPVRIAAVDEKSVERFGQWPWPRSVFATMVEKLSAAGVAVIGFDIVFSEAERSGLAELLVKLPDGPAKQAVTAEIGNAPTGDQALGQAIGGGRVVLGMMLTNDGSEGPFPAKFGVATAGDDPMPFLPNFDRFVLPLPTLTEPALGLGALNWRPDRDQIVRKVPIVLRRGDQVVPGLAAESLRVAQDASTFVIRSSNASGEESFGAQTGLNAVRIGAVEAATDANGEVRIAFTPTEPQRFLSIADIIDGKVDPAVLEGSIVLVGMTAIGMLDHRATPIDPSVPGVEVHAQLIEHLLSGAQLSRPDWAPGAELFVAVILSLILVIALPRMGASRGAILVVLVLGAIGGGSFAAYAKAQVLLDPIYPGLSAALCAAVSIAILYGQEERQKRAIRDAFGRYLSPAMVERLASDPKRLQLGGELREITVLFCDLRGFTSISERMDSQALARFMNEYLTAMTDAILDAGGTLDKYVGDAVIAFWNAPLEDKEHAPHALAAVAGMRRGLVDFNERIAKKDPGTPLVRFGIGLATGPCSVGNFGSNRRFDYSAFGDDVNVAARLEQATKSFGVDLLVAESTRKAAPDAPWLPIGPVKVKGKAEPFLVYTMATADALEPPALEALKKAQEALVAAWQAGDMEKARELASEAEAIAPPSLKALYKRYATTLQKPADEAYFDLAGG